jgi:cell wall-associated NlpC family hydrolase
LRASPPTTTTEELERACAFVRRVVGLPWSDKAEGPDAFDCRGLTKVCLRELFQRELPLGSDDPAEVAATVKGIAGGNPAIPWTIARSPSHGDVVTLRSVSHPRHIGVWLAINRGGLLHAVEEAGVMFEPMIMLTTMGWSRFVYYRYQGAATTASSGSDAAGQRT